MPLMVNVRGSRVMMALHMEPKTLEKEGKRLARVILVKRAPE